MSGCACNDGHQFDRCFEVSSESFCRDIHRKPLPQMRFLCRNPDRAIVRMASTHAEAADCLYCGVGNCNAISAEGHRLGKVGRHTQSASNNQCYSIGVAGIEMLSCPGECRNRRHRNIVAEDQWRSARAAAAAVEDNVVDANIERGVDVLLDMLRRQLESDGNATRLLPDLSREIAELAQLIPLGKARRRDRRFAFGQLAYLGNLALDLVARQVTARTGLGTLPTLEVKRLCLLYLVPGKSEAG